MSNSTEPQVPYVRMRDKPQAELDLNGWPKDKTIAAACKRATPPVANFKNRHAALRKHEPVPAAFAVVVTECVLAHRAKHLLPWDFPDFAAMWEPALNPVEEAVADAGWYDWNTIKANVLGGFLDPPGADISDPDQEMEEVARALMVRTGERATLPGQPTDRNSLLHRGEREMLRSLAEYTRWLTGKWERDRHAVRYVLGKDAAGKPRKVGATVTFGLTQPAAERFMSGQVADKDLTAADVEPFSPYVFVNNLGRLLDADDLTPAEYSKAEITSILLQAAYTTSKMEWVRPHVVAFGGTHVFRERLRRQGFRETGHTMPGFDIPIMVLDQPHGLRNLNHTVGYTMLCTMLWVYQYANAAGWGWPAPRLLLRSSTDLTGRALKPRPPRAGCVEGTSVLPPPRLYARRDGDTVTWSPDTRSGPPERRRRTIPVTRERRRVDQDRRALTPDTLVRYMPVVVAAVERCDLQPADRYEVAQEVYLAALTEIRRPDCRIRNLQTWLGQAVVSCTGNCYRNRRKRTVPLTAAAPVAVTGNIERLIESEAVSEAVRTLPDELRVVFELAWFHQRHQDDIAEELGLSRWVTYDRLKRATAQVRAHLARQGFVRDW